MITTSLCEYRTRLVRRARTALVSSSPVTRGAISSGSPICWSWWRPWSGWCRGHRGHRGNRPSSGARTAFAITGRWSASSRHGDREVLGSQPQTGVHGQFTIPHVRSVVDVTPGHGTGSTSDPTGPARVGVPAGAVLTNRGGLLVKPAYKAGWNRTGGMWMKVSRRANPACGRSRRSWACAWRPHRSL